MLNCSNKMNFRYLIMSMTLVSIIIFSQVHTCKGFSTYTQGAWSSSTKGQHVGTLLEKEFKKEFPWGLTVGGVHKITFNSVAAIKAFLPQVGPSKPLKGGTSVNPTKESIRNELAGELVAATLNIKFDKYLNAQNYQSQPLKNLKVCVAPFINMTVHEVLLEANAFLGGKTKDYKAEDFLLFLKAFNYASVDEITAQKYFTSPLQINTFQTDVSLTGLKNGTIGITNISGGVGGPYQYQINFSPVQLPIMNLSAGVYVLEVTDKIGISAKKTIVINDAIDRTLNPLPNTQNSNSVNTHVTFPSTWIVNEIPFKSGSSSNQMKLDSNAQKLMKVVSTRIKVQ